MAKEKKRRNWPFFLGMAVYALLFLGAAFYGLGQLSAFLDAFERSRPQNAINGYMDSLTAQHIADKSQALIDSVDHTLQSEEACREVIINAVSAPFSYAKVIKECTDDKQVFVIRSGGQAIGTMEIRRQEEIGFGFSPWAVTEDSFDLSYLLCQPVSATVPDSYTVLVGGTPLTADYQVLSRIQFPQLSQFYGVYDLPCLVTYQAGPFLGTMEMTVQDENGSPAVPDLEPELYLDNCSAAEKEALGTITEQYLRAYMAFSTRKGNDSYKNYAELCKYMVPEGELASRMKNAIAGLIWVSDRGAVFDGASTALMTHIGGGRYLVDVTYTVTMRDYAGPITAVSRVQLIILETAEGLRVEVMRSF